MIMQEKNPVKYFIKSYLFGMTTFLWILLSTFTTSLIALVGLTTLFLNEKLLKKILFPLVAFSAGALLGGAFLHMIPEAIEGGGDLMAVFLWVLVGFTAFFMLEQFISWHHCHKVTSEHKHPVTYLIMVADTLHNFIGGLAIGSAFMVDIRLGIVTWVAATAHEIPQELGDFGILIHGGWNKTKALLFNYLSATTVILGGLVAYSLSSTMNIMYLLPFAAGNFIYIATADLIPEIKHSHCTKNNIFHFIAFVAGLAVIYLALLIHI